MKNIEAPTMRVFSKTMKFPAKTMKSIRPLRKVVGLTTKFWVSLRGSDLKIDEFQGTDIETRMFAVKIGIPLKKIIAPTLKMMALTKGIRAPTMKFFPPTMGMIIPTRGIFTPTLGCFALTRGIQVSLPGNPPASSSKDFGEIGEREVPMRMVLKIGAE